MCSQLFERLMNIEDTEGGMGNNSEEISTHGAKEPYIGMVFNCIEDAYVFYNCYALHTGFGIRRSSNSKSQKTGEVIAKKFECDKSGYKYISVKEGNTVKRQRDTRVGCTAKLDLRKNKEGQWAVTGFVRNHCHDLDTPRRAKKHRSHNQTHKNPIVKNLIDELHSSGMGPSRIAKTINITNSSSAISSKNVSNHLKEQIKSTIGIEGSLLYSYLQQQKDLDPNFYFSIQLENDGILRSIYWADRRSRDDYFSFGDVMVFDVTYRTNKFMMPFAPFTGVNHNRQSILFGSALLSDESEESFVWLFKEWLQCMLDRSPKVIITDMDGAMYNAIKIVFPNTRHRFCSWHIGKHLMEHVHELHDNESDFNYDYKIWFNCKSIQDCEFKWSELVKKYDIKENSWLMKMWGKRIHWVPAYLTEFFVAGMTSSSRSESINAFFDGFVTANTRLIDFIGQYEKALQSRRQAEEQEDYMTMNSNAHLVTSTLIEQMASKCYTRTMFKLFQHEFKSSLECWYEIIDSSTFNVGLSSEDKSKWYIVHYDDSETLKVKCVCSKFETNGYLCMHILHIMMAYKHLQVLPEQFILKRLTIQARNVTMNEGDHSKYDIVTPMLKWRLTGITQKIIELASMSRTIYDDAYARLNELLSHYQQLYRQREINEDDLEMESANDLLEHLGIFIRDPHIVKTKGRPKASSRIASAIELTQSQTKRRTCGSCGGKGHYTTTCPHKS